MVSNTASGDKVDVPDEWFVEAGFVGDRPKGSSYRATPSEYDLSVGIVPVSSVRPPRRNPGVVGLHRPRSVSILRGFLEGDAIPPLRVYDVPDGTFRYRVGEGYHRFHLSIAVGFTHLPVEIGTHWEPFMTGDQEDGPLAKQSG